MKPESAVARKADYRFERIERGSPRRAEAAALLAAEHYARGGSNTAVLMLGLVRRADDKLVGVAQWLPPTMPAARFVAARCAGEPRGVLALSRLAIARSEPKNAATARASAS